MSHQLQINFICKDVICNLKFSSKLIKITLNDEERNESWGPSGSLDITNLGVVSFCLRKIDSLVIKYMQADIIINSHIIYVIFTECTLETANYLIVKNQNINWPNKYKKKLKKN